MSTVKEVKAAWGKWEGCEHDFKERCPHWIEFVHLFKALEEPATTTPEQQVVLDAAVAWREWWGERVLIGNPNSQKLAAAVDAMTRPPSVADRLEKAVNSLSGFGSSSKEDLLRMVAEVRALEAGK